MAEFKLGRIKFVYQGTWTTSRSYVVDDVITNGGKTYICVISHTSSSTFVADLNANPLLTKWNLIADGSTWRNNWAGTTYYNLGDIVVWGATVYICKTAHTSQTYLEDDSNKWDQFSAGFKWLGAWTTSTRYKVRDLVYYGGSTYVCKTQHTSASTDASGLENDANKWDLFNQSISYLGNWSGSSVRYKINDVVKSGANLWICTAYHTSTGTTLDTGNFAVFVNGFQFGGEWSTGNDYQTGDVVSYGGNTYTAVQNNGSASPQNPSTETTYWKLFTPGLVYSGEWTSATAYKIGNVVTLGGYTYAASIDNSVKTLTITGTTISTDPTRPNQITTSGNTSNLSTNLPITFASAIGGLSNTATYYVKTIVDSTRFTVSATAPSGIAGTVFAITSTTTAQSVTATTNPSPPYSTYWNRLSSGIRWASAANTTYTNVASSNVTATGSGSPTFTVTRTGTAYSAVIGGTAGTGYTVNDTLKILGSALGGASPGNDLVVKVATITGGGATGPIGTVTVTSGYASTWKTGVAYVAGDAVYYGNSSYICVSVHIGSTGVNDPISDTTATYWNILSSGADTGALTTQGDMVYYGANGPVRLPIGTDGQVLRVNGDQPSWSYYGQLQNIVYVAPSGTDVTGNGQGLTLDKPWATLLFACRQIEDGYLNTNAGLLLKLNKQFMMKEVNNFIKVNYTFNVTGTSGSGNTFIVGGSSTTSQITTANMYYGMPITFSATTGNVTVGTVYYVNTIPSSTTFTISEAYQSSITRAVGANSSTASIAAFNYTESKAERDTGTVVDGIIFDLTHGGNLYTETATQAYFKTLTTFVGTGTTQQAPVFAGALSYLKDTLFSAVLTNSAPAVNYQTVNSISIKAIQNTTGVSTSIVESYALATVQGLLSIITTSLATSTYGNIPQLLRPNTTIYLKTGTFNEYGPIVVPTYTAIVGDELRSTIVQVASPNKYLSNDKPKTAVALQRVQSVLTDLVANNTVTPTSGNTVAQVKTLPAGDTGNASAVNLVVTNTRIIQDMFAGGGVITGPTNPNYPKGLLHQPAISMPTVTGYNSSYLANYGDAVTLIQANYQFIKDEIVSFLNTNGNLTGAAQWSSYSATYRAETLRDLTYILDSVCYDMTYGCNSQSLITGSSYYSLNTAQIVAPYLLGVQETMSRLSVILGQIVQKSSVTRSSGNTTTQYTTGTAGSAVAAAFAQARIADIRYWLDNGTPDTSAATFTGSISATTLTVSSVTGTVKIGQIVTGGTVAAGTYITAGSDLSWTVSVSQTATATGSTLVITPVTSGAYALATTTNKGSFDAIQFRASETANDAQSWVTRFYQNESPILTLTNRDAGYVVSALAYDVLFGGNFQSIQSGRLYNSLVPSVATLHTSLADSTYGVLGFIGERVKLIAANGAVVQTQAVIDEMIAQMRGQPTATATFNGTITGTQLVVNSAVTGTIAIGMKLTGTGIANGTAIVSGSGTTWLLNYNQSAASTTTSIISVTTSIVLNGTTYTNILTAGTTSGFVPGLVITITGTTIGNLVAGTYYIKQVLSSTQFTVSTTYLGTVFTINSTAAGAMTAVVYGIYGGLGLTTDITAKGTDIPVTAVTTSTNLITVATNAGMYVNMPIVFTSLPANITATATAITSNAITLSSVTGVVVGQRVWFTGYTPQASGTASSIVANQRYYVQSIVSSTITIAATFGGSAITLTNATGLTLTATFDAAGGITPGNIYWINSVTAGTYPAAGTTITVTATYKSGTALTITNTLTGLTARASAGMPINQGICDKNTNGTIQPWNNPTRSYESASGYNNTLSTIQGAEIIRANKAFLANEMSAYTMTQYTATVTTTASNGTITCSGAHNLTVNDPIVFSSAGSSFDFSIILGTVYWVLTTPSTSTFTITTTVPGTGTATVRTLVGGTGTMSVSYYMNPTKCIRDAEQYINGLVYDLELTGNYKSTRAVRIYLSAVEGSTSTDVFHLRNGTGLRNMTTNGLSGSMSLPNELGTKRPTAGSYSSLDAGFGPNDSAVWISNRSPYTQNLTLFGSGCSGMKIDAALHSGGNKSIVANDYTTIISDGFGVWCTGSGALTELVSVFAYYSYAGYMAEYGGRIRATNGNSSYGTYGVIAEGIDSYETPIYGRLNNRANPAYITNVVTDGTDQILRLEFENAGNSYSNAIPTINGAGYNIVTIQDEFRDSAVFETRLVDLNNGQGVGGSNYLTAANVAQVGGVGSVTIANSDIQLSSAYIGMRIQIIGGTGVGQFANIIGYAQASKLANIVRPNFATLTITTNNTTVFTVSSTATMYVGQPIYLGAAIGGLSLLNAVYSPTVYYVSTTSFTSTTFRLATTLANANAGTNLTLTATSATPAVTTASIIIGTTLTVGTLTSGVIYPGMLLTGGSILPNTYIVANISGSGAGSTWTVSVSQNLASTALTGTIAVPVYEAGWDHVVPGTTIESLLDATSAYIIEPTLSYTAPGFTSTAVTMTAAATTTWAAVAYGQGTFVATSNATGIRSTATTTDGTTWAAGGNLPTDASSTWGSIVYGGGQNAVATAVVGGVGGSGAILQAVLGTGNTNGQIISVTVINGGYNYATPPTIVITDANGTGATATARVLNGSIQAVDMIITGSVYSSPIVTAVNSSLSSITATTYGSGYYTSPLVTIAPPVTATGWSSGGATTLGSYYSAVDTTVSPNVTNYYLAGATGTFSSTKPTFTNSFYGKSGHGASGIGSSATYGVALTYVGTLAVSGANTNTNTAGYGVISYTISQTGYGYTTTPTVTVTDANAAFMAISTATSSAAYSTDQGASWSSTSGNTGKTNLRSLAYGNNLYIAVGGTSSAVAVSYSPGGVSSLSSTTWSDQSTNITASAQGYSSIAYGAGVFCAVGGASSTISSFTAANPTVWYAGASLPTKTWVSVVYGNGRFVALASDGTMAYTINWQQNAWTTSPSYAANNTWITVKNNPLFANGVTTWSRIRYGQGLFVAIATSSQAVATSPDGVDWTYYATGMPSSSNWLGLAFGNSVNATLGRVPTWVSVSNTSGKIATRISTGARAQGRIKIVNNTVIEVRMAETGSGYPRGVVTATSTTSTGTITVDNITNVIANQPIVFSASSGGIVAGTYYFVKGTPTATSGTAGTIQISTTAGGSIFALTASTPTGMTYFASPITTQTDPNKINTAPLVARIGNGALGNPSFANRGIANTTATASYSGDGYSDLYQVGSYVNVTGLFQIPTAGCNVVFNSITGINRWYKLVSVTNILGVPGNYTATFQINPGLSTLLAPAHDDLITTNLAYSNVRLTGHDFLYIGTGGFSATNYPYVDATKAVAANQQLFVGGGRVFFTSTDQDGNFNVGNLFGVQQSTGTATLNASAFNLSGLQSLTLGSVSLGVGSATITQFSTDPYFTANSDAVVPTQKAIKAFITAQIGGGQSSLNVNTITSGQIYIAGNTISNTNNAQILITSKMTFQGGIDGAPVALVFFGQR
jgi:hypothetical protein